MNRFNLFLFLILISFELTSFAQISKIDSLQNLLNNRSKEDTAYVDLMVHLCDYYNSNNPDTALSIAKRAYDLSQKLNYKSGEAWSLNRISGAYWMKANYPDALRYSFLALSIFEELKDDLGLGQSYNSIANTYNMEGENRKSLTYYDKSIAIYSKLNDDYNLNRAYANIGRTYYMLGEYDNAIINLNKVIEAFKDNTEDVMYAIVKNTSGDVLQKLGDYNKALDCYFEALSITEKLQIPRVITYSTRGISEVYQFLGETEKSIDYAKRTLKISQDIGYAENVKNAALIISDNYKTQGNFTGAYEYYKMHAMVKDSMFNEKKESELNKLKENHLLSQSEKEILLLKAEQKLQKETNDKQKVIVYSLIAVILVIAVLIYVLLRNNRIKNQANILLTEQRNQLSSQNTEILQQREEILATSEMLENANKQKERLFSIVSHDLKSPFNALLSIASNIDILANDQKAMDLFKERLSVNIKSLSAMLNNLLNWSKMLMQGYEIEKEEIDIHELVEQNIKVFEVVANEKGIELKSNISDSCTINGYSDQLDIVIRNLINNAIKFTEANGTVTINVSDEGNQLLFAINDTGVGIAEELKDKIFDETFISSTPGTAMEQGSGLGLFICRDFVQKNGGEIWIESEEGKGSTFYFTLPK